MKYFFTLILLLPFLAKSQIIISEDSLQAPDEYANIHAQKISGDSLVSTFVIFIKEHVPLHKHQYHSENVVILEGEGIITLGSITKEIRAGDIIFIPADTFHEVNVTSEKPMKVISIQAPEFDGTDRILYKKN
jgi:mannose-6-phosphate isomerase-like protein (cupin superfamily)